MLCPIVPNPSSVIITSYPPGLTLPIGSAVTWSCSVTLSWAVDVSVSVSIAWARADGFMKREVAQCMESLQEHNHDKVVRRSGWNVQLHGYCKLKDTTTHWCWVSLGYSRYFNRYKLITAMTRVCVRMCVLQVQTNTRGGSSGTPLSYNWRLNAPVNSYPMAPSRFSFQNQILYFSCTTYLINIDIV